MMSSSKAAVIRAQGALKLNVFPAIAQRRDAVIRAQGALKRGKKALAIAKEVCAVIRAQGALKHEGIL